MWDTWREFKSKGDTIFVDVFIMNYLFSLFFHKILSQEGIMNYEIHSSLA